MGRRKMEMKKIENKDRLQVTFSKRRKGLFGKAAELSALTGAHLAVIVFSPAGRSYSFGHPSVDDVMETFLNTSSSHSNVTSDISGRISELQGRLGSLEEERLRMAGGKKPWWEADVKEIEEKRLEEFERAMKLLRQNVVARADELSRTPLVRPVISSDHEEEPLPGMEGLTAEETDFWAGIFD